MESLFANAGYAIGDLYPANVGLGKCRGGNNGESVGNHHVLVRADITLEHLIRIRFANQEIAFLIVSAILFVGHYQFCIIGYATIVGRTDGDRQRRQVDDLDQFGA